MFFFVAVILIDLEGKSFADTVGVYRYEDIGEGTPKSN